MISAIWAVPRQFVPWPIEKCDSILVSELCWLFVIVISGKILGLGKEICMEMCKFDMGRSENVKMLEET